MWQALGQHLAAESHGELALMKKYQAHVLGISLPALVLSPPSGVAASTPAIAIGAFTEASRVAAR